jgi:hypothetical protein
MGGMGLEVMRLHSYEEFQTWLANDLEVRDELEALIGLDLGLDVHSLDTLESFLLGRYGDPDEALRLDQRNVLDAAARHIGLVMVLGIDGARWDLVLDDERDVYYRLPIVRLPDGAEECPVSLATAALDRRTGEYVREVVEGYIEDYEAATEQ